MSPFYLLTPSSIAISNILCVELTPEARLVLQRVDLFTMLQRTALYEITQGQRADDLTTLCVEAKERCDVYVCRVVGADGYNYQVNFQ